MLWRLDRRTHHSVTRDEHGDFWVGAIKNYLTQGWELEEILELGGLIEQLSSEVAGEGNRADGAATALADSSSCACWFWSASA